MDQQQQVSEVVRIIERPENAPLLYGILAGFLDRNGRVCDDFSFMFHFDDMLAVIDVNERKTSNYRGQPLPKVWNDIIDRFDQGWSGAYYGVFCRSVQHELKRRHFASMPSAIEGDPANWTELQREVMKRQQWLYGGAA